MPRCFLPPVGLWSRPHAKAAVLEDDGLVGHCIVWLWLQLAESVIDVEWRAWYIVLPASCRGMQLWISWQGTWWDTALFLAVLQRSAGFLLAHRGGGWW